MARDYDTSAIPTIHDLQSVEPAREEPGFSQVIFRGIDQMIGFSRIGPDREESEPHTHPFEQMNMLLEGELEFIVGEDRVTLTPYDSMVIPPEVPHTSSPIEDESALLLAFWPLREDRLSDTDYQSEFQI